jgi:hypothetical protein
MKICFPPSLSISVFAYKAGLLGVLCILLSSCDSSQNNVAGGADYFPLEEGRGWSYRVETELTGQSPTIRAFRIDNVGKKRFRGETYSVRRTSDGTDYYVRRDESGIFRYAKRTIIETRPTLDASRRMVLPMPMPDNAGKSWSVLSQTYTLHRVSPNYEPPYENIAYFHMTYSVVGLDEDVTVPAGHFKHCLLVEGQAQIDQYAGANTDEGSGEVEVTTREWYAPGVGLVKMERTEPLDGSVFKGGKVLMELVEG